MVVQDEVDNPERQDRVQAQMEALENLPAMPAVSSRLLATMGRSNVDLREVGNLIASDGTLSAEVLRIANTSIFNIRSEVKSVLQALAFLGLERVKGLACTIALRNYLGNVLQIPALQRCWRHNLSVAVLADEMANWMQTDGAEAYTAGILHDIGRLALITLKPDRYLSLLDRAVTQNEPVGMLEQAEYGFTHAEAGAALAEKWNLSPQMQEVMRDHHAQLNTPAHTPLGTVHFACRITDYLGFGILERSSEPEGVDPIAVFLEHLPPRQRERLKIDPAELQFLVAARVNAMEA